MLSCFAGMVGDVNLFLNNADEPTTAEIEVQSNMVCFTLLSWPMWKQKCDLIV